jgi:hypothetical protein
MIAALPQMGLLSTLGLAAAVLMVRVGVGKRMIDVRRPPHSCASCGRAYSGRRCPWCVAH